MDMAQSGYEIIKIRFFSMQYIGDKSVKIKLSKLSAAWHSRFLKQSVSGNLQNGSPIAIGKQYLKILRPDLKCESKSGKTGLYRD